MMQLNLLRVYVMTKIQSACILCCSNYCGNIFTKNKTFMTKFQKCHSSWYQNVYKISNCSLYISKQSCYFALYLFEYSVFETHKKIRALKSMLIVLINSSCFLYIEYYCAASFFNMKKPLDTFSHNR